MSNETKVTLAFYFFIVLMALIALAGEIGLIERVTLEWDWTCNASGCIESDTGLSGW